MKIRRAEHLIRQIRRQTDNEILGNDDGISSEEILQYLNDAQELLQEAILSTYHYAFVTSDVVDAVARQETYDGPSLAFGNQGIVRLDFSYSSSDDYRPLKKVTIFEERSYIGNSPRQYIPLSGRYLINPVPDVSYSNGLKRWYNKILPKIDITRSLIADVTTLSGEITYLELDPSYPEWNGGTPFFEDDYLCIVDRDGNIKTRSIPYNSIDPITGVVTMPGNHVLLNGESATVGDYVVRGYYSTTNSELANFCEKYLIEYGSWRVLGRDESESRAPETQTLMEMKQSIIDTYGDINADIDRIPAINFDYSEYL